MTTARLHRKLITICAAMLVLVSFAAAASLAGSGGNPYNTIRFVQVSDVHFNPDRDYAKGRMIKYSKDLLEDVVRQVNGMQGVDFVVFTGDMADNSSVKLHEGFADVANGLNVPWYWTTGNHDISTSKKCRAELLKTMNRKNRHGRFENTYYSFAKNGFLFMFLDGAVDDRVTSQGTFSAANLNFLDEQLNAVGGMPAVIFQHFPVVYPISSSSHEVTNQAEYLRVIDSHPNVKAVLSGHYHIAKIKQRNGVLHASAPSLVQYPNAFRVVTMRNTGRGIEVDFRLIETGLKDIQEKSLKSSPGGTLQAGKEADRNQRFMLGGD